MTSGMTSERRDAFDEMLEDLFAPDVDEDAPTTDDDLKLPAMLPSESVYQYRTRAEKKIRRRSQRLRDLEADVLGDDMSLFMAPEEESPSEDVAAPPAVSEVGQ